MANLTTDPDFNAAVAAAESGVDSYANSGVRDALALTGRAGHMHNLQAHYNGGLPLAVHYARNHQATMARIRAATKLTNEMDDAPGPNRAETRHAVWDEVKAEMIAFLNGPAGNGTLASQMQSGAPISARDIANTFLSTKYGGGQTTGDGGNTVIKRTLKLLAHLQIA